MIVTLWYTIRSYFAEYQLIETYEANI